MARIAILLAENLYVRNFLKSGALERVINEHEAILIRQEGIRLESSSLFEFDKVLDFDFRKNYKTSKFQLIFDILMVRNASKSKSFQYRIRRNHPKLISVLYPFKDSVKKFQSHMKRSKTPPKSSELDKTKNDSHLAHYFIFGKNHPIVRALWYSVRTLPKRFFEQIVLIIRSRLISGVQFNWIFRTVSKVIQVPNVYSKDLMKLVEEEDLELILIPSAAYEGYAIDLIGIARELKIKTFLVVDNWDNLSSKTIFWRKPDYVGTWGPQSSRHAVEIQGFDSNQIFDLGCPRFSNYSLTIAGETETFLPKDYILFVGSFLPFDEIDILVRIDTIISKNSESYKNLKIVYRPHPAGQMINKFESGKFENVILDPQFTSHATSSFPNRENQLALLSLDYYPKLIKSSRFIVGGLTSMLIEGSLFGKYYLGLVHSEKENLTSPNLVFKSYLHFEGILNLPNFYAVENLNSLEELFLSLFELSQAVDNVESNDTLNDFVLVDTAGYPERILQAVNSVLNSDL